MAGLFKEGGEYSPPEDSKGKNKDATRFWKILAAGLVLICLVLLIVVIVLAVKANSAKDGAASGTGSRKVNDNEVKSCTTAKMKPSRESSGIFEDLSKEEIRAVLDFMLAQPSLKLTPYDKATVASNYIYFIKLYVPDKKAALQYLDEGGSKPARQALVSLFKGAEAEPVVEEFIVSPAGDPTSHALHRVSGQHYPIHFNARPFDDVIELSELIKLTRTAVTDKLRPLLLESYDGYSFDSNCTDKCLMLIYSSPMGASAKARKNWFWFNRALTPNYEFPINFELYIQHEGSDVSTWKIEKILYNDQVFGTADELMAAYRNGTLKKIFLEDPKGEDRKFATYERRGNPQPKKPARGPELYEPDGQRYAVDRKRIEYMGWEFEFRMDLAFGLAAYDVRFNGERIIYELSIQEAIATYGGYYPSQASMNFLDASFRMGMSSFELVRGVDCPNTATFFDLTHFIGAGSTYTMRNAVCVFELNTGIPLRRHYDNNFEGGYNFYGGLVTNVLVVRSISTPYNYDYLWDFIFYPNGVIQVKVSASGYVLGSFYTDKVKNYGFPLYKHLTSTVHDHLMNVKVDLDVGGVSNSYETIEVGIENVTSIWNENTRRVRKVLQPTTKKTEEEAAYKFNFDRPKYLNFYSEKQKNRMGVRKGYRIQHAGIMKQLYPEEWLVPMMSWSLYQLAVTRHKESERRSSSIYNLNAPADPQVDFRNFIGNESIVNQDLVAWVTMGMMHIPHSEDLPNTATAGTSAGFYIRPFNYFDEDPSIASTDAVLITPPDKEGSGQQKIERYGTPTGPACVPANRSFAYSGRYYD